MNILDESKKCVLCYTITSDSLCMLYQKGVDSLNNARKERGSADKEFVVGKKIHHKCRKAYCDFCNDLVAKSEKQTK